MAGVENIINEILQEAQGQADEIISQAQAKAQEIKTAAEKEGGKISSKYAARADRDVKEAASRTQSQIGLRRRQAVLAAKQEIISRVIEKAYEKLSAQDDASYFDMILGLLGGVVQPQEGLISFSEKDLGRLPSGFEDKLKKAAKAAGGKLKVSDKPADIESGFVLSYGGIDENCSFKSLFDANLNRLQDEVHKALW